MPRDAYLEDNVDERVNCRRLKMPPLKNLVVLSLIALNVILSLLLLHRSKRESPPSTYGQ